MPAKAKISKRLQELTDKLSYRQYLFLAFLVSCLLGLFLYLAMSGEEQQQAEQPPPKPAGTVQVVTAKQDIPQRAFLTEAMLQVSEVPEGQVPAGAVRDMAKVKGRATSVPIQQGDVITDKKVYMDLKMAGFPGMIPPDCRAISIPISDATGVGGFARPGDFVDVMIVNKDNAEGRVRGEIALQNVMLLGINKSATPPSNEPAADGKEKKKKKDKDKEGEGEGEGEQQPAGGNVQASGEAMALATLALTPAEALQLAVLTQEGQAYLMLRPLQPTDMFVLDTDYSVASKDRPAMPVQAPAPAAPAPAPVILPPAPAPAPAPAEPSGTTVEVIRGVESSTVGVSD